MSKNVFLENHQEPGLSEYMNYNKNGRENLGDELPVQVYRLLEYSMKEALVEMFGKEVQVTIFRKAGYRAGDYFARNYLDLSLPLNQFVSMLQKKMKEYRIGILRVERVDEVSGKIVLTVSEDADCSGLPLLGDTVCNYDEGFIAGILSVYTGKEYSAIEIDCWATGDRVCRFSAQPVEK